MVLLVLLLAAAIAAGILMIDLFRQSTTAQAGQAAAEIVRACDAIAAAYRFYSAGWQGPSAELGDEALSRALTPVVFTALRDRPGVKAASGRAKRARSPMLIRPMREVGLRPTSHRPSCLEFERSIGPPWQRSVR